jgi:hypothetical protein
LLIKELKKFFQRVYICFPVLAVLGRRKLSMAAVIDIPAEKQDVTADMTSSHPEKVVAS